MSKWIIPLVVFCGVASGSALLFMSVVITKIDESESSYQMNPDVVLQKISDYRKSVGLNVIEKSDPDCSIATTRLKEIRDEFSHRLFTAKRFCSVNCRVGENLARNFRSEDEVFEGWKNSSSHNAIMLGKDYKYGCVATDGQLTVLTVSDVENVSP